MKTLEPASRQQTADGASAGGVLSAPKLRLSHPWAPEEREAERLASEVLRDRRYRPTGRISAVDTRVSRQATPVERDEQEPLSPEEEARELEESNVRASRGTGRPPGDGGVALKSAVTRRGTGRPIDPRPRRFMELRLGSPFDRIRIHTDESADAAAQSIGARAFTVGPDIWFRHGAYDPVSHEGRTLLAHELVHTVQQSRDSGGMVVNRSICPDSCARPVSHGRLCRADSVTRDNCSERNEADSEDRISHIRVLLDTRQVHLFWNGAPRTDDGRKEVFSGVTPNASETPRGWDVIGVKCGPDHTSWRRYNMAWFTGFRSHGYRYGFHDSQPLGAAYSSAGCVRASCELAETINRNTRSNWTSIIVRNSAPGD